MATYYLDSSAIVKGYDMETGPVWVRNLIDPANGHELYTARVAAVETVSALARRMRRPGISPSNTFHAIRSARADFTSQYLFIEVMERLVAQAVDVAVAHGLRGYDAVHLAAALELSQQTQALSISNVIFVGADAELNAAAAAEGLSVDNPDSHP